MIDRTESFLIGRERENRARSDATTSTKIRQRRPPLRSEKKAAALRRFVAP